MSHCPLITGTAGYTCALISQIFCFVEVPSIIYFGPFKSELV